MSVTCSRSLHAGTVPRPPVCEAAARAARSGAVGGSEGWQRGMAATAARRAALAAAGEITCRPLVLLVSSAVLDVTRHAAPERAKGRASTGTDARQEARLPAQVRERRGEGQLRGAAVRDRRRGAAARGDAPWSSAQCFSILKDPLTTKTGGTCVATKVRKGRLYERVRTRSGRYQPKRGRGAAEVAAQHARVQQAVWCDAPFKRLQTHSHTGSGATQPGVRSRIPSCFAGKRAMG